MTLLHLDGSDHLTIHCYRAAIETVLRRVQSVTNS